MKILNSPLDDIEARNLKEGQVAVITQWPVDYRGLIIIRNGNMLIEVGGIHAWDGVTESTIIDHTQFRVRVLPKGTRIEV